MPPGSSNMFAASTNWCAGSARMPGRTSLIVPPSINTSAANVLSADTTVPFLMRSPINQIFPGLARQMIFHAFHRDAAIYRTNQRTQIAAHALVFIHAGSARMLRRRRNAPIQLGNRRHRDAREAGCFNRGRGGMRGIQMNALMRPVPACDVAQLAANALFFVNARDDLEIQIQMIPISDLGRA